MAKVLDCSLEKSEFKLQSQYYVRFLTITHVKSIEPPNSPNYGLNSITAVLLQRWL